MNAVLELILRLFRRPLDAVPPTNDLPPGNAEASLPRPCGLVRHVQTGRHRVILDLDTQVLGLEVASDRYMASFHQEEAPISPVLPQVSGEPPFVSAAVLAHKAKLFDDGLYATVELMAQRGAGQCAGKAGLLSALASRLASLPLSHSEQDNIAPVLCGATVLGGGEADPFAPGLQAGVQGVVSTFLATELLSKPLGFYTWTPELTALFRQDRMLQTKLSGEAGIACLVKVLHGEPALRAAYEGYLRLVGKLTNPLSPEQPDLRSLLEQLDQGVEELPMGDRWFFPTSRAHETELVKALYGERPIPPDFELITELIRRIDKGDLQLAPKADSGWYDYQSWALEPLVIPERMPEANKLRLGREYRKLLLDLFKGILSLTRETHVKQLEIAVLGGVPRDVQPKEVVSIQPELSAEPLPSYYLRRAHSYRFIHTALGEVFGEDALRSAARLTPSGPKERDLWAELVAMETLFYGAHCAVSYELGLHPDTSQTLGSGEGPETAARHFRSFASAMHRDAELTQDMRMMVPVFYDQERHKTKVWAFLGWAERPVDIRFTASPTATVVDGNGRKVQGQVRLQFDSIRRQLPYPITAEVYVDKILNRDEFRRHCDLHKNRSAILANLR